MFDDSELGFLGAVQYPTSKFFVSGSNVRTSGGWKIVKSGGRMTIKNRSTNEIWDFKQREVYLDNRMAPREGKFSLSPGDTQDITAPEGMEIWVGMENALVVKSMTGTGPISGKQYNLLDPAEKAAWEAENAKKREQELEEQNGEATVIGPTMSPDQTKLIIGGAVVVAVLIGGIIWWRRK